MGNRPDDILQNKLKELPVYQPSEKAWRGIDQQLEDTLWVGLNNLQEYEPEPVIWDKIESNLSSQSLVRKWYWLAVASILLAVLFFIGQRDKGRVIENEEVQQLKTLPEDKTQDHRYQEILTLCMQQRDLCESRDFAKIKNEYEHLRTAEDRLREAIGPYNTEQHLLDELNKIETQKLLLIEELSSFI